MKNALLYALLLLASSAQAQILRTDANPNTDPPTLYELATLQYDQPRKHL